MERTVTAINAAATQERKIRTAAYCRVSSDSADQLHSFSAQVRYYTRLIGDNECMELVDIYADEGISGTKTKNRDDFCRLINDCKNGRSTVYLLNRLADLQETRSILLCTQDCLKKTA